MYLVKHTQKGGEPLVMKEVSLRGLTPQQRHSTLNEVEMLKKIDHPHIISFRDAFKVDNDNTLCICMEWASGGDLAGHIASMKKSGKRFSEAEVMVPTLPAHASRHTLAYNYQTVHSVCGLQHHQSSDSWSTTPQVLRITWQLTSALAHCHHELHMLHRDVKPQNIFLSAEKEGESSNPAPSAKRESIQPKTVASAQRSKHSQRPPQIPRITHAPAH